MEVHAYHGTEKLFEGFLPGSFSGFSYGTSPLSSPANFAALVLFPSLIRRVYKMRIHENIERHGIACRGRLYPNRIQSLRLYRCS